jgi:hypothetical protein
MLTVANICGSRFTYFLKFLLLFIFQFWKWGHEPQFEKPWSRKPSLHILHILVTQKTPSMTLQTKKHTNLTFDVWGSFYSLCRPKMHVKPHNAVESRPLKKMRQASRLVGCDAVSLGVSSSWHFKGS